MLEVGYYNGEIGPLNELKCSVLDRAVYFGDGCYDATMVVNGKIVFLEDHLDRFYNSLNLLSIPFQYSREELTTILYSLVKEFDTNNQGMIYWQASRGTGLRQHNFPKPEETKPNLFAYIVAKDTASKDKTMSAITVEDERFLFCNIKTLNLIPNVLAAQKALEAGADEVIFHRGQEVTEMAHSNISFIIKGHFVYHPFDNKILPGIAVKHLIKNAKKLGIPTEERIVTLEEALAADELINSSSGAICQRIVRVDEKPVGKKDSETFTKLQDAVFEEFYGSVN